MAAELGEHCERCRRPAPPWAADEYDMWEAFERADGSVKVLCPGCLTRVQDHAIAADMEQVTADADDLRSHEQDRRTR